MNPDYFGGRSLADTLSTLVHEMVHVWQHYAPVKKCRGGYHDRVWGAKMEEVGLMPSNTGLPGGKKNGQQMTHYIIRGGRFQKAVYDLLKMASLSPGMTAGLTEQSLPQRLTAISSMTGWPSPMKTILTLSIGYH